MTQTISFLKDLALEMTDVDENELSADMTFEEIGFDSLAFVELQLNVFKKFGIRIQPDAFASGELKTLNDLAGHIESCLAEQKKAG